MIADNVPTPTMSETYEALTMIMIMIMVMIVMMSTMVQTCTTSLGTWNVDADMIMLTVDVEINQ